MFVQAGSLLLVITTTILAFASPEAMADEGHNCKDVLLPNKDKSALESTLVVVGDQLYSDCGEHLLFQTRKTLLGHSKKAKVVDQYIRYLIPTGATRPNMRILIGDLVDPESWRHLFDYLYRDEDSLFCHRQRSSGGQLFYLTKVNPETFQLIVTGETGRRIPLSQFESMVDEASSEVEKAKLMQAISQYAVSGNKVFFRCSTLRSADSESFIATGKWEARDKENQFLGDRVNPIVDTE